MSAIFETRAASQTRSGVHHAAREGHQEHGALFFVRGVGCRLQAQASSPLGLAARKRRRTRVIDSLKVGQRMPCHAAPRQERGPSRSLSRLRIGREHPVLVLILARQLAFRGLRGGGRRELQRLRVSARGGPSPGFLEADAACVAQRLRRMVNRLFRIKVHCERVRIERG